MRELRHGAPRPTLGIQFSWFPTGEPIIESNLPATRFTDYIPNRPTRYSQWSDEFLLLRFCPGHVYDVLTAVPQTVIVYSQTLDTVTNLHTLRI